MRVEDKDWSKYSNLYPQDAKLIEDKSDYFRVIPLLDNVNAQILKCDVPPIFPSNNAMERTMELCHSYFKLFRSKPDHVKDENTYDLATSAGLPFCKDKGLTSKRKVLDFDKERLELYIADLRYPDIGAYNDKDELLSTEELERNKTRGIFGSSFHGIYREKFLYGRQNKIILENHKNCWIKYGFVKQYGGFNTFLKNLEDRNFRWESDCSGFDRKIYLGFVYELRNANIINKEEYLDVISRVTQDNVTPLVLLPNGYLVRRPTGNNSGKNNTTVDNSIAHFIINVYIFVKRLMQLGFDRQNIKLSIIMERIKLGIYSDDKLGSFNLNELEYETPEEFLEFERDCYAEFGLEIKKSAQYWTYDPELGRIDEGHSFLGSYASYSETANMYMPSPRFGKICSSFTQRYKNDDIVVRFARILNLTLNCFPDNEIFVSALKYLKFFYDSNQKKNYLFDELLHEVELDLSVTSSFQRIYLGFESRGGLKRAIFPSS